MTARAEVLGGTRFEAHVGERQVDVVVETLEDNRYRVHVGGRVLELDVWPTEEQAYSVLQGDESCEVDLERVGDDGGVRVRIRGAFYEFTLLDEREQRRRLVHGGDAGAEGAVTAPMPGKVVKVLVELGDEVEAGQSVVVVEAMKMENELRAPRAGVIKEIKASAGAPVELGEVLVVIE